MLKFVNAEETNTITELVAALFEKDNIVKAVAVTGENTLLESLWSKDNVVKVVAVTEENASELRVYKVNYIDDKVTVLELLIVWDLFRRWKDAGLNVHHAKSPFGCKDFAEFVNIDKYMSEVTYVMLLEKKEK